MESRLIGEGADGWLAEVEASRANPGIKGLLTGFRRIDEQLGGIDPGHYGLITARTGVGKTAFALAVARNMMDSGKTAGFITLEMTPRQLEYRLAAAAAGVDVDTFRHGWASNDAIKRGYQALKGMNMRINTTLSQDVGRVMGCVREMAQHCDIVFIDYMQLMRTKAATRVAELALASKAVFQVALETKVPCVGLVQLNRDADGVVPRLSNMKGTGDFEEDAVWVMALHKNEAEPDDRWATAEDKAAAAADNNTIEVHLLKNRWGKTGVTNLYFDGAQMRYTEA